MEKIETENSLTKEEISMEQDSSSFEIIEETLSENEEIYFGNELISDSSEETKVVWVDSESEEENLRQEVEKDAEWINDKKFQAKNKTKINISLKYKLGFFMTNFNIKLIKCFSNIIILVDTMNIVYILDNLKLKETIKFEKYRITDVELFNDFLYFCSEKSNRIKEINVSNFEIKNINKELTRNIRKLKKIDTLLYVLGDTFLCVDERLNVINEVFDKILDVQKFKQSLFGLNANGNILQFDKYINMSNKIVYEEKFLFKNLEIIDDYLIVVTTQGLIFIDNNLEYVKETKDKSDIIYVTKIGDMILYTTKSKNGIKIMNNKLQYINIRSRLPMCFYAIKYNNDLLMCSHREVHHIKIKNT